MRLVRQNERKQLNDFFAKFYKVRSDIVHSGRFKVTESENQIVTEGVNLASRLLLHEIALSSD